MTGKNPGHLNVYLAALQASAERARVEIGSLIDHSAEKGRVFEEIIKGVLGRLLPKRFAIGTGFVISADGQQSGQTDIVIYDNIYNAPILSEFSTYLFPVEAVYATMEVKSRLDSTGLRSAFEAVRKIRKIGSMKRYRVPVLAGDGSVNVADVTNTVPPRSYIVAFDQSGLGSTYSEFQTNLLGILAEHNDHIHGVCLLKQNWFAGRRAFRDPPELFGREGNGLAQLYSSILRHQDNFSVYPMSLDAYLEPK